MMYYFIKRFQLDMLLSNLAPKMDVRS